MSIISMSNLCWVGDCLREHARACYAVQTVLPSQPTGSSSVPWWLPMLPSMDTPQASNCQVPHRRIGPKFELGSCQLQCNASALIAELQNCVRKDSHTGQGTVYHLISQASGLRGGNAVHYGRMPQISWEGLDLSHLSLWACIHDLGICTFGFCWNSLRAHPPTSEPPITAYHEHADGKEPVIPH